MTRTILSLPLAVLLLAACQSTESDQSASASAMPETTASAETSEPAQEEQMAVASEPTATGMAEQASTGPVTYSGDWIFEGRAYPFEIVVSGDSATYTDLGARGKAWQASSVTRRGDDILMEIEDYKFQGYPYGDIGLVVVDAGADGTCDRVDWHGAAAFTRQAKFTAECG